MSRCECVGVCVSVCVRVSVSICWTFTSLLSEAHGKSVVFLEVFKFVGLTRNDRTATNHTLYIYLFLLLPFQGSSLRSPPENKPLNRLFLKSQKQTASQVDHAIFKSTSNYAIVRLRAFFLLFYPACNIQSRKQRRTHRHGVE